MAHTTTCSSCGTTFRVTAEQLLARDGNVRCGQCGHVFNAHPSLALDYPPLPATSETPLAEESVPATEFAAPPQPEPAAVAEPEPYKGLDDIPETVTEPLAAFAEAALPLAAVPETEPDPSPAFESVPDFEPEPASEPVPDFEPEFESVPVPDFEPEPASEPVPDFEPEPEPAPAPDFAPSAHVPQPAPPPAASDESLKAQAQNLWKEAITAPASSFVAEELIALPYARPEPLQKKAPAPLPAPQPSAQPRDRRWLWPAGSLLLLCGLLAQGALYFRTELAAINPGLRPAFEQVCGALGCRVALPQNPDLLSIETSSLEADPDHTGIVVLHAISRNRAPYPQAYPIFELTLTDYRDKLLARRLFQPQEYLPPGTPLQAGMPASDEIEVKLTIDLGETKAAGYRVYLFYPSTTS